MRNFSAICVDANLVIQLATSIGTSSVPDLWEQWRDEQRRIIAPMLIRYEVTNALHRYARAGMLTDEEVSDALTIAMDIPLHLYSAARIHVRAINLASRFALPAAYDAHYLAVADQENAEFWTTDQRLFNTVSASLPWVRLVSP